MADTLPPLPKCTATNSDCIESRARVHKARGDVHTARAVLEYKAADADFALAAKLRAGTTPPPPPPPATITSDDAARFILKASLSASEADIAAVKSQGYAAWLNAQMDAPIVQGGVAWLAAQGFDKVTIEEYYTKDYPGDFMIWNQLISEPNSVRKRVAFALSEFFVVSLNGLSGEWRSQAIARYWDQLNENAFGNFRKLIEDMTLNYGMGQYLSTLGNKKEDGTRQPDQNYAREIMQLFTIGLFELNSDGTRKLANGLPVETYTQADVINLARVFTGYDADGTNKVGTASVRFPDYIVGPTDPVVKPMTADTNKWYWNYPGNEHSMLEKKFLGVTIPANTGAEASLKIALDALFNHPNVGPFFCKQMIQRLATSNPTPAYVDRVAKVFNNNGSGVRGDLRAVFKAILLDTESGKLREPVLRFVQWARTFGATNWKIGNLSAQLGQSPLRSPSVFNYFRPGYVPANTAIAANALVAPEFQIVNEVSTVSYVNFMTEAIPTATYNTTLDQICLLMSANQITDATKATIKTAVDAEPDPVRKAHLAVLLVMASPDYLVTK